MSRSKARPSTAGVRIVIELDLREFFGPDQIRLPKARIFFPTLGTRFSLRMLAEVSMASVTLKHRVSAGRIHLEAKRLEANRVTCRAGSAEPRGASIAGCLGGRRRGTSPMQVGAWLGPIVTFCPAFALSELGARGARAARGKKEVPA